LISSGACTWVELFSVFESLGTFLNQLLLAAEQIANQCCLFSDRVALVFSVFGVAKIAQNRDLVQLLLVRHHDLRRAVLDRKVNAVESFEDATPLNWLHGKSLQSELYDPVDVRSIKSKSWSTVDSITTYKLYDASAIWRSFELAMFQFSLAVASMRTFSSSSFAM
jgi:hypothetical protein